MKRILYLTLLTTIGVIGSAILLGKLQQHNLQAQYPAPGQMVDVGGYNLHIDCRGAGSPTILLEAGQGESSLTWSTIRPQLAQRTRVCAYDRAGYGWSERSPHPRTVRLPG